MTLETQEGVHEGSDEDAAGAHCDRCGGVAAVAVASASPQQKKTVVIGWAYDGVGNMAAYDGPALATAKERVAQLNKVRSNPARYRLITCNTQGNKPAIAKACAAKLVSQGADIVMTTCDVDYAAPVVQYAIDRGKLTVAACIGTDQMGPKRFGPKGRLAFSYGNVAQDEGSAMAEFAWKRGWRNASLATDTVIVYFRNVVQAFKARWQQLGGRIATEETYQSAGGSPASWQNTVTRLNARDADVIVTATAPPSETNAMGWPISAGRATVRSGGSSKLAPDPWMPHSSRWPAAVAMPMCSQSSSAQPSSWTMGPTKSDGSARRPPSTNPAPLPSASTIVSAPM